MHWCATCSTFDELLNNLNLIKEGYTERCKWIPYHSCLATTNTNISILPVLSRHIYRQILGINKRQEIVIYQSTLSLLVQFCAGLIQISNRDKLKLEGVEKNQFIRFEIFPLCLNVDFFCSISLSLEYKIGSLMMDWHW